MTALIKRVESARRWLKRFYQRHYDPLGRAQLFVAYVALFVSVLAVLRAVEK